MKSFATIAMLSLAAVNPVSFAQGNPAANTTGIGIPFGSRDPRPCGDLTGSMLTQQKAMASIICREEQLGQTELKLIENLSVQIGNARPYNFKEDYNAPNIDPSGKVYPIRGSFRLYSCVRYSDYMQNKGRNCSIAEHPNATGFCYKDTWGSWRCAMGDVSFKITSTDAPPPGFAAGTAAAPPPAAGTIPRPANGTQNHAAPAGQAATSNPKPDFSEMEKWFDILRYEYSDNVNDHHLYIWVKGRVANPPSFCMQFLDRGGMMIDAADTSCGTGIHMGYSAPQPGEEGKIDVMMPQEKNMPRVVSAKVVRMK